MCVCCQGLAKSPTDPGSNFACTCTIPRQHQREGKTATAFIHLQQCALFLMQPVYHRITRCAMLYFKEAKNYEGLDCDYWMNMEGDLFDSDGDLIMSQRSMKVLRRRLPPLHMDPLFMGSSLDVCGLGEVGAVSLLNVLTHCRTLLRHAVAIEKMRKMSVLEKTVPELEIGWQWGEAFQPQRSDNFGVAHVQACQGKVYTDNVGVSSRELAEH